MSNYLNNSGQTRLGWRTLPVVTSSINYSLVTSGLSINLDSSNIQSYSGTGVNWTDLTGNGNNGVLTGGVSYNSGLMTLDGVDDYIEFNNIISIKVVLLSIKDIFLVLK